MNIINSKEYDDSEIYVRTIFFDNTIQVDSLVDLIKQFENASVKMNACHCNTFSDNGSNVCVTYSSVDEILNFKKAPSPYANFLIEFVDRNTLTYQFDLITGINLNYARYEVDKKKIIEQSNKGRSK